MFACTRAVSPAAFGLTGKKIIAVLREQGAIVGGSKAQAGQITAEPLIKKLRGLSEDSSIAGVVLRVDSPGASPAEVAIAMYYCAFVARRASAA